MPTKTFTRGELFELVWSKPVTEIAEGFGMSSTWLKKICTDHDIPVPWRGYWQVVAAGRQPSRPALPNPTNQRKIDIRTGSSSSWTPRRPEGLEELLAAESARAPVVVSPGAKLLPFTVETEKTLNAAKPDDYGCCGCYKPNGFRVRASPGTFSRVISICNALETAFKERGFKLKPGDRDQHSSASVIVCGIELELSVAEASKQIPHVLTNEDRQRMARWGAFFGPRKYDHVPSGNLVLELSHFGSQKFRDKKTALLEEQLGDVIRAMIEKAFYRHESERRRIAAEKLAEEERIDRLERQRLAEIEAKRVDALFKSAEAWSRATQIRQYVAAYRARAGDVDAEWIAWALSQADKIDPLSES